MHIDPSQVPAAKNLATPVADTKDAAEAKPAGTVVIGKVDKLQGDAWVIHDGQKVPAKVGAALMQGDSVETAKGAQISLVFADRTTFVLKDKGLVGLDEFSYDPATKTGKESFLVAQGGFSFVSGDIAKTQPDAARISTPIMTLGIRGTTVAGAVGEGGATTVALLPDPGSNFVGEVAVSALGGGGQTFTLNSAGSGIVGATSGGSWSVSANAGAAVAAIAPAAAPPPAVAPVMPVAPTGGPAGGTGSAPTGTGNGQQAAVATVTADVPQPPPPPPVSAPPPPPEPAKVGLPADPVKAGPGPEPIGSGNKSDPISSPNHPPTVSGVVAMGGSAVAGTATSISFSSLLTNASDVDHHSLTITSVSSSNGSAAISGANVIYTPSAAGALTLTYTVDDGHGGTVTDTATITVAALSQSGTILHSSAATTLTDSDFSGFSGANTLTFDVAAGSQGATLGANAAAVGITKVDASTTTGGVTIDASALSTVMTLTGGSGNDTFTGGSGADSFVGGLGNDVIHGASADALMDGGGGTGDVLSVDAVNFDDGLGNNGQIINIETINLTNATTAGQWFKFDDQNDGFTINVTSSANVTVQGSQGNDVITGGTAGEYLFGDQGNDSIVGGSGSNTIDGGSGTDTVSYAAMGAGITATVTGATASVVHSGGTDTVSNAEVLLGTTSNDTFKTNGTVAGTVLGGGGVDSFTLTASPTANLTLGNASGSGTLALNVAGRSAASLVRDIAWNGSDMALTMDGGGTVTVTGNAVNGVTDQGGTTSYIVAQGGASTAAVKYIVVGIGTNTSLTGNTGDDMLMWTSGNATLIGGGGSDAADFGHATGAVVANLFTGTVAVVGGSETVHLQSTFAEIRGGDYADTLTAGTGTFVLQGGDGNNVLDGTNGTTILSYKDQLSGVTVDLSSGTATHGAYGDTLTGIDGVVGSDFADTITGGTGAETLDGGFGANTLTGGLGADTFTLHSSTVATATATITDFNASSVTDYFSLSNAEFGLGTTGTLTTGTTGATYAEGTTTISGTAQDFGDANAGVVAIQNGANVELWHTTNMNAADSTNSHLVGTLNSVNTSALDNTNFHLAV